MFAPDSHARRLAVLALGELQEVVVTLADIVALLLGGKETGFRWGRTETKYKNSKYDDYNKIIKFSSN